MICRVICLAMLASSLVFSQYIKPFDFNQYVKPFKPQVTFRLSTPVVIETRKVCAVPLLEFKPQVQSRMPVIKPTVQTAQMPKLDPPAPACPAKTTE
jgi:hypothetical protein